MTLSDMTPLDQMSPLTGISVRCPVATSAPGDNPAITSCNADDSFVPDHVVLEEKIHVHAKERHHDETFMVQWWPLALAPLMPPDGPHHLP